MWHKVEWKERPIRLELTRVGLLVSLANHYTTRGAHNMAYSKSHKKQYKYITIFEWHMLMSNRSLILRGGVL